MKNIHILKILAGGLLISGLLILSGCTSSGKMVKVGPKEATKMVQDESFVFIAQKMNPQRGIQRDLMAYYDVHLTKTNFNSFLPFLGRLYAPVIDPWNAGLRFTSTNFKYSSEQDKKGNWKVTVTPKDVSDIESYQFTIFSNGTATLFITSINKSNISFDGYVQPIETMTEKTGDN